MEDTPMYRYELHCHENLMNRCGRWSPQEMVKAYSKLGYTGIVVTNHFFNNECCKVSNSLPWEERVEKFYDSYETTRKEGEKLGLDVFFAFEYSANSFCQEDLSELSNSARKRIIGKDTLAGCDFLIYGLDKDWLLSKDDSILRMSVNNFMKMVKSDGGTVIQAHPFRLASGYMDHISLFPKYTDGIEILNGNPNTIGKANRLAKIYAEEFGFFPTAGTDAHCITEYLAVTDLKRKAHSMEELIAALKNGEAQLSMIENPLYKNK